jgi:hypothetical protein
MPASPPLAVLLAAALLPAPRQSKPVLQDVATPAIPRLGELNPLVVEVLRRYPTDGTHTYHWPKTGGWKGCTKDLEYAGELLCAGDPQKRAYCCGLTFEVFLDAWRLWCQRNARPWRIRDLDLARVRALQGQWFGSEADKSCMRTALCDNQLGVRITDLEDALPGDFVQLWRHDKSGHSVVFLAWLREGKTITGLRYWSTQDATKGIGEREERFGTEGRSLDRAQFWLVRAGGR